MSGHSEDGYTVLWHQSGTKHAEGLRVNGRKHGAWTYWYDDGSVMEVGSYLDDEPHGRWIYYWNNQNKKQEGSYDNGRKIGFWSAWYDDGIMSVCGEYNADREHGFWQSWDKNGQILSEGNYERGDRHGSWRFQGIRAGVTFITEWYHDELTNVPGRPPRQVQEHRGIYYPVVPGQLLGQITPFANPGSASGLYFGCLTGTEGVKAGVGPFTYLFQPVTLMNETESAGLALAIWARNANLTILERVYTSFPDIPISDTFTEPELPTQQYIVLSDPLVTGVQDNQHRSFHDTIDEAITVAQMTADRSGYRTVVAAHLFDYPLDL